MWYLMITEILSSSLNDISLLQLSVTAVVIVLAYIGWKWQQVYQRRQELYWHIHKARQERQEKTFWTLENTTTTTTKSKEEVLSLSAVELAQQIRSGKLDALEVVTLFSKQCRQYGRPEERVNAITEELYDEAYSQAQKLVQPASQKNNNYLPFLGVPISVKECYAIKGTYSTGGLACRLLRGPNQNDSLIVDIFKKAGALPICCGNTIQTMMLGESVNRIWGRSRNPWDLKRTPGGSSGGDAALVAMRCVPLAIGGDVAGSIRIPASCCGVIGFKPTSTRLSNKGCIVPRKNDRNGVKIVIPPTPGPIARTVDDCALFMKTACVPASWESDCKVPRVPFDSGKYENRGNLKIGYFATDHWFEPCATARRGLNETIENLKAAGHTCVLLQPPTDGWFNYGLLVKINAAEGNLKSFVEALEGEEWIPEFNTLRFAMGLPALPRWIIRRIVDKRRSFLLGCSKRSGISVYELWQLFADILDMRARWENLFQESRIDSIIFPALALAAFPHGLCGKLTASLSYMFIANLLCWPCGVVPVTTVKEDEQHYSLQDLPEDQRDELARLAHTVMEDSAGLPLSVSIMAPLFQDETCLRVMKEVERVSNFSQEPTAYQTYENGF